MAELLGFNKAPAPVDARSQGLGQIGDAIVGGLQNYARFKQQKDATDRQRALEAFKIKQGFAQQGMELTPEESQAIEQGNFGGLSELANRQAQSIQQQREAQAAAKAEDRALRRGLLGLNIQEKQRKAQEEQFKKSPQGKLERLGATEKGNIGAIASGLQALEGTKKALEAGYDADYLTPDTPIIGGLIPDDPFTQNQRLLAEVIGRLQSGAAITEEEEKRFKALGPRPGDDAETQKRKVEQQRSFLENKLNALGFKPTQLADLGFDVQSQQFNQQQQLAPVNQQQQFNPAQNPNLSPIPSAMANEQAGQPALMQVDPNRAQRLMELRMKAQGGM